MEAEAFAKIHPREFHRKFLEQDVRCDGRPLHGVRKTAIVYGSVSSADGSAMVRIGHTSVVCGIKLEVGVPRSSAPKEGQLVVNLHLTPLCSPQFSVGRPSADAVSMAQSIQDIVTSSGVFSAGELCISEGASCWVAYADVMCLDYDGNMLDAAFLSVVAALQNLTLPDTHVEEDGEVVISETKPYTGHALTIHHVPVSLTFGFLDEFVISDPCADEEEQLDAKYTVVYNDQGKLCGSLKPGGASISKEQVLQCITQAKHRCTSLLSVLEDGKT